MAQKSKEKEYKFTLYRKDNKNYSFIVEPALTKLWKVKIVLLQRDAGQKRIDMAEFFEDYRTFRCILTSIRDNMIAGKEVIHKTFGGTGGKRSISYYTKKTEFGISVCVSMRDELIKIKYPGYKGTLLFTISDSLAIRELFDVITTLNNWEIANITSMVKNGEKYDPEETLP